RQWGSTVDVGRAHRLLRSVVVRRHLFERDRPVEEVGSIDASVDTAGFELVVLEPRCRPRPVSRRATDGLDDPGWQVRKVAGDPPGSGRGPGIEPGHLVESLPLIVDVVLILQIRTRFEND